MSVQELHNTMVSPPELGGIKESKDVDNNIIISDSTLCKILSPQLKKYSERCKVICGCQCYISDKIVHSYLLSWQDCYLKKLKDQSHNVQNRRSDEMANCIFETYKTSVIPHGRNSYQTTYNITMAKKCAYPPSQHKFSHYNCVFRCCENYPIIDLPSQ